MKKREKEKSKKRDERRKSLWRIWVVDTVLPAVALALVITTFIGQLYKIPSGSMRPTLQEGDRILVCKFIYGLRIPFSGRWFLQRRPPKRGDVAVFLYDKDPWEERKFLKRVTDFLLRKKPWSNRRNFIKRVIGTPGERIEIKDGDLYVNGQVIDEPPALPRKRFYYNKYGESLFYTHGEKSVPEGNFFVLGDNSSSSKDSRYWGFVSMEKVKGKALFIIWPPGRIRLIR